MASPHDEDGDGTVDIFVARQPIFDVHHHLFGYELLFRDGPQNFFPPVDGSFASRRVIHDSQYGFGLDALTGGKPAFINLTREVLLQDPFASVPKGRFVAEILETVEPGDDVVAACVALKKAGHPIALDDFAFRPGYEPLVALADIIKVDFLQTTADERAEVVRRFARPNLKFLAEKVATRDAFDEARALGYSLVQGYFFAQPQVLAMKDVSGLKLNYLRLAEASVREDVPLAEIESLIKRDVALSMKFIKHMNAAAFGWSRQVRSIREALAMLGREPFRRWMSFIALVGLGDQKAGEVIATSLARAHFCELLAISRASRDTLSPFLTGLFSLVDVLVGRPLLEVLETLAPAREVRAALISGEGVLGDSLALILAYERADWTRVREIAVKLGVSEKRLATHYRRSLEWARKACTG